MLSSRNTRGGSLLLLAALTVSACGGTPPAATPSPTLPPGGATLQPTLPGGATPLPTQPPAGATLPPGGGGGATFPDGPWTGGTAHLVVSGDYSSTVDLPLLAYGSLSTGGITLFQYVSADAATILSFSVEATSVTVTISTPQFVGGGGTTDDAPCAVNFARKDANAVEGTASCLNSPVISTTNPVPGQYINLQASFTATR